MEVSPKSGIEATIWYTNSMETIMQELRQIYPGLIDEDILLAGLEELLWQNRVANQCVRNPDGSMARTVWTIPTSTSAIDHPTPETDDNEPSPS